MYPRLKKNQPQGFKTRVLNPEGGRGFKPQGFIQPAVIIISSDWGLKPHRVFFQRSMYLGTLVSVPVPYWYHGDWARSQNKKTNERTGIQEEKERDKRIRDIVSG